MSPVAEPEHFASIQVLRGVAAMAVVLFHLGLFNIGYAGVDIFFVISGFVMGLVGPREPAGVFLLRRLIRVAPLYWIVLLVLCALSLVPRLATTFAFDAASLAKSILFIPYLDASGRIAPLLFIGWTLNVEMAFYLVVAAGLLFRMPVAIACSVLALSVIAGSIIRPQDAIWITWTNPLLLEFVAGLLLAKMTFVNGRSIGTPLLLAGVAAFALAAVCGLGESQTFGRVILLGGPAAMLVYGAVAIDRAAGWPKLRPLAYIGDASYSLYLWHGLVLSAMIRILPAPFLVQERILTALVSLAFALAAYRCLERPMTRFLQRQAGIQPQRRAQQPTAG